MAETGDLQWGGAGPPVVGATGSVLVPVCSFKNDATIVFRSSDRGKTFTSTRVPGACGHFPILAARGNALALAVFTGVEGVVARSYDGGVSFSERETWGANAARTSPWPLLGADGSLTVVWYGVEGPSRFGLHVTTGDVTPRADVVVATVEVPAESDRSDVLSGDVLTHFAHGALTLDDRVVVTWVDGPRVRVAIETERALFEETTQSTEARTERVSVTHGLRGHSTAQSLHL